jgi:hypothetical protein
MTEFVEGKVIFHKWRLKLPSLRISVVSFRRPASFVQNSPYEGT